MAKAKALFESTIFNGIMKTVVATGIIGLFSIVWAMREDNVRQNTILTQIQKEIKQFNEKIKDHDDDITSLKINDARLEAKCGNITK